MDLSPELEDRLRELLNVFLAENRKLNLSALRTEEQCWVGNILDSLAFLDAAIDLPPHASMIDVGTGGGFPLLPLSIALPDVSFVGLDAIAKKMCAVERIVQALGLRNVRTCIGRTEKIGHDPRHRQQYDVALSRAVGRLNTLLEYSSPFVRVGGRIVLWKSIHMEVELTESRRAQEVLRCPLERAVRYRLPGPHGERQLLIFLKTAPTPEEYPRAVGIAKKKPL